MQCADECECRYIFNAVENLDELVLKIADVRLKAVTLSHFDVKEVVVILLDFPTGDILGDEHLSYLLEIVERTWRQRIKSI